MLSETCLPGVIFTFNPALITHTNVRVISCLHSCSLPTFIPGTCADTTVTELKLSRRLSSVNPPLRRVQDPNRLHSPQESMKY